MRTVFSLRTIRPLAPLVSVLMVAACGGGDGDSSSPGIDAGGRVDGVAEDGGERPDFAVIDLVTSDLVSSSISATVSVTNEGEGAAAVPSGWLLVSTDPDFTSDYHYVPVTLMADASNPAVLAPGESGSYVLDGSFGIGRVRLPLRRSGAHYARLWLNPDLSARVLNPEERVVESHAVAELDYDNNLSPLAAFEGADRDSCTIDAWEQNDALTQATPVMLDVRYEFNGCDETYEVLVADLQAGESYELYADPETTVGMWQMTVIDPSGKYLVRELPVGSIVTADTSGPHHIVAAYRYTSFASSLALEIISR